MVEVGEPFGMPHACLEVSVVRVQRALNQVDALPGELNRGWSELTKRTGGRQGKSRHGAALRHDASRESPFEIAQL
jgi:hypothetical protein